MLAHTSHVTLSRRERQIMDILYQRGRASAGEIHAALKKDFRIRSVGGRIGKRGEPVFKFARMFVGDSAEGVKRAEEDENCQKDEDAKESEPAHG